MGRPRSFDTDAVLVAATDAFVRSGYNGTSIDDLLRATGLQRASLYQAFGSKRGLFVTVMERPGVATPHVGLLLVALMDLAADDPSVRQLAERQLRALGDDAPAQLGQALIVRGGLTAGHTERGKSR